MVCQDQIHSHGGGTMSNLPPDVVKFLKENTPPPIIEPTDLTRYTAAEIWGCSVTNRDSRPPQNLSDRPNSLHCRRDLGVFGKRGRLPPEQAGGRGQVGEDSQVVPKRGRQQNCKHVRPQEERR